MALFEYKSYDARRLREYGFKEIKDGFEYKTVLLNGQFDMIVRVCNDGTTCTEVYDVASNEPYILHRVESASGEFVGKVRAAYFDVLKDIDDKCFVKDVFKSAVTREAIAYAYKKYGDSLEFLWEKFPADAILRRKDNGKWYALFVTLPYAKLGLKKDGLVEIAVLRVDPAALSDALKEDGALPAYHMNKRNWITLLLDGSVPAERVKEEIDKSYVISARR